MNTIRAKNGQDIVLPEGSECLIVFEKLFDGNQQPNVQLAYITVLSSAGIKFSSGENIATAHHSYVTGDKVLLSFINSEGSGATLHVKGSQGDSIVITV